MCDLHATPIIDESVLNQKPRRAKLWDVNPHWHCAVIGTCIPDEEIQKLCLKMKAPVYDGPTACYKRHSFIVGQARCSSAGVPIYKFLEKKYARSVRTFAKAKTVHEVEELWEDAYQRGYIPGPFWAVMTHPHSSIELKNRVYGEVHMMSHLEGANNRADHRVMSDLENTIEILQQEMSALRKSHNKAISKRDALIGDLKRENKELSTKAQHADELEAQLLEERDGAMISRLERRIDTLLSRVIQESERADNARARIEELQDYLNRSEAYHNKDLQRMAQMEKEVAVLEARLQESDQATCMQADGCPGGEDLCGRCIAYIGGQTRQTAVFRDVVEKKNGQFLHHDGGLHDGQARLQSILAQADAVMFPVTCISHEATREIKKVCAQHQKPFVPLRSQGLGAFSMGLESLESDYFEPPSGND